MRSRFTSARALWKVAQVAQVLGLEDDRGDGRADPGGGRHGGGAPGTRGVRRSHQRRLISTGVDARRSSGVSSGRARGGEERPVDCRRWMRADRSCSASRSPSCSGRHCSPRCRCPSRRGGPVRLAVRRRPPMTSADLYADFIRPARRVRSTCRPRSPSTMPGVLVLPSEPSSRGTRSSSDASPFTLDRSGGTLPGRVLSLGLRRRRLDAMSQRRCSGWRRATRCRWQIALVAGQDLDPRARDIFGYGVDSGTGSLHEPRGGRAASAGEPAFDAYSDALPGGDVPDARHRTLSVDRRWSTRRRARTSWRSRPASAMGLPAPWFGP